MLKALAQLLFWLASWFSPTGIPAQPAVSAQSEAWRSALSAVVESERAFARSAGEKGTRDAFLAFIAENGVLFRPQPVSGRKYLLDRPGTPGKLSWRPVFADVAVSGDLGYTTGPYEYRKNASDPSPSSYGNYFTIWQKQPDGAWRFVIDYGTANPAPAKHLPDFDVGQTGLPSFKGAQIAPERALAGLVEFERKLSEGSAREGLRSLEAFIADDARFLRPDRQPAVGRNEVRALLEAEGRPWTLELIRADTSLAGDLGYTYGTCKLDAGDQGGSPARKGYYLRIYRMQSDGTWRLRADVTDF